MPHWPNLFSEDTFAPIFHIMECEFKLTTYRHPNSYCIMCPFSSIHGTVGPDPSYFHSISNETCVVSGEQLFSLFCLINFCAMSLIILIHNTLKSFETYLQKFSFWICALTSWNENICHPAEITATALEKWKKISKAGLPSVLCSYIHVKFDIVVVVCSEL